LVYKTIVQNRFNGIFSMSIVKLNRKTIFLTILIVTTVIIMYSIITRSYTVLFKVNTSTLLLAVFIELIAWSLSAIRLRAIHKVLDGESRTLSFKNYFYARLLGGLFAYLTPSAIGGEPARAYYIHVKTGSSFSRYLALTIYEVIYDIIIVNIIAITLSVIELPYTIPVIIVSILSLTTWLLVYSIFKNIQSSNSKQTIVSRINRFVRNKFIDKYVYISKGYSEFGASFREIVDKIKLRDKILIVLLSLAMYSTSSFTITLISLSISSNTLNTMFVLKQYFRSFQAFFYSLSLGAIPTPGGSIAVEYGLSIVLNPEIVLISRTISYYSVILIGSVILLKTGFIKLINK